MLCLDGHSGAISHGVFTDVLAQVLPGDLLVFNDTRVIPARLWGQKETGGKVEILIERIDGEAHGARTCARQQVAQGWHSHPA